VTGDVRAFRELAKDGVIVDISPPKVGRSAAAKLAAKQHAEERKARKLHVIATRRATAQGLSKEEFIGKVVSGRFRPITAEDIANEPDPE